MDTLKDIFFSEKIQYDGRFENPFYTFDIPVVGRSCDLVIPEPSYFLQALMVRMRRYTVEPISCLSCYIYSFLLTSIFCARSLHFRR